MSAKQNPIAAYALLKAAFELNVRNAVELTLPLARRALINWKSSHIELQELQQRVEEIWGLQIPQTVLRYLLPKLARQNLVEYDANKKLYMPRSGAKFDPDLKAREEAARQLYRDVTQRISAALQRESDLNMTAGELLETWLDTSAIAFLGGTNSAIFVSKQEREINRIIALSLELDAMDGPNQEFAEGLTKIALGDALYRAIKEISEFDHISPNSAEDGSEELDIGRPMDSVSVYLDTGILFRALGHFGPLFEDSAREFLGLCKGAGCRLMAFRHNVEEVQEGLQAIAGRLYAGSGAFGPVVRNSSEMGYSAGDLLEAAANVEEQLDDLDIEVGETPEHEIELTIDELALEYRIETDVKQDNPIARRRDVNSLTSIFRLRDGKSSSFLEKSEAILVTHNKSLADAATKYFNKYFNEQGKKNIVQICMTDVVFATRMWAKLPTVTKVLPKQQIIAHAISNLYASPELEQSCRGHLENLVEKGRLSNEVSALPGVAAVGVGDGRPPDDPGFGNNFVLEDRPLAPGQSQPSVPWSIVDQGFFEALGVSVVAGAAVPPPSDSARDTLQFH